MSAPAISVIVSVYEQPWMLDLSLAALANQDFGHSFEVIVCDDGSSPEMLRICRHAADTHNLDLRFVWQPDREYRLARSRNNAIRCAQGDLLVFLDGDIVVQPDFLARHVAAHEEPHGIVCGPRKWVVATLSDEEPGSPAPEIDEPEPDAMTDGEEENVGFLQVLELMERYATDVDRPSQVRWFRSAHPWLACAGFGFSVARSEHLRFDEAFVGWGPEDRELICRLVQRHGYTVRYRDDIEVFHLEAPPSSDEEFDLTRPARHADIVNYLRNKVRFWTLYPDLDLMPALKGVLRYSLNPDTDTWERIPREEVKWEPGADLSEDIRGRIKAALQEAAGWLDRKGTLGD